jgi:tryptophanyl-tRNA synthetase
MRHLLADPGHIDEVLNDGSDRARVIADTTIAGVKDVLGFVRKK